MSCGFHYADGSAATVSEIECVARAFGFSSIAHMQSVLVEGEKRRRQADRFMARRGAA